MLILLSVKSIILVIQMTRSTNLIIAWLPSGYSIFASFQQRRSTPLPLRSLFTHKFERTGRCLTFPVSVKSAPCPSAKALDVTSTNPTISPKIYLLSFPKFLSTKLYIFVYSNKTSLTVNQETTGAYVSRKS
jgi:hypothetical protein